jgi:hypothetical protein
MASGYWVEPPSFWSAAEPFALLSISTNSFKTRSIRSVELLWCSPGFSVNVVHGPRQ